MYEIPISYDGYYNETINIHNQEENIYSVVGDDTDKDKKEEYGFGYLDIVDIVESD